MAWLNKTDSFYSDQSCLNFPPNNHISTHQMLFGVCCIKEGRINNFLTKPLTAGKIVQIGRISFILVSSIHYENSLLFWGHFTFPINSISLAYHNGFLWLFEQKSHRKSPCADQKNFFKSCTGQHGNLVVAFNFPHPSLSMLGREYTWRWRPGSKMTLLNLEQENSTNDLK